MLFGVTEAEMKKMTRDSLRVVIDKAYELHGMTRNDGADYLLGEYYSTLDCIKSRIDKEKELKV